MNVQDIIAATITEARKQQRKDKRLLDLTHKRDVGFYAWQQYEYMRECNPALPEIPELRRVADSQFSYSASEVEELMLQALQSFD